MLLQTRDEMTKTPCLGSDCSFSLNGGLDEGGN